MGFSCGRSVTAHSIRSSGVMQASKGRWRQLGLLRRTRGAYHSRPPDSGFVRRNGPNMAVWCGCDAGRRSVHDAMFFRLPRQTWHASLLAWDAWGSSPPSRRNTTKLQIDTRFVLLYRNHRRKYTSQGIPTPGAGSHVLHLLDPVTARRPTLHPRFRHFTFWRRWRCPLYSRRARYGTLHPTLFARHRRRSAMGTVHIVWLGAHVPEAYRQVPELLRVVLDHRRQHALFALDTATGRITGSRIGRQRRRARIIGWWASGHGRDEWPIQSKCSGHGRGSQELLRRRIRGLAEDNHEPVLPCWQWRCGQKPGVQAKGGYSGEEVLVT